MYLKRLELVGFKSFAQKTVLDFPGGITAVVGPNGSGKTNVVESIRWLLGEREAKNMRSLKAEDLIFAGTPNRPRLGLAQAAIVFDNKNNFFPVDYSEVSIRRRLERSGESGYFINDAEVRLKDIIDFFAKARLGTKGFSIINQGDSDLFVRSTPKERREMLEEILGLREFQLKKHDAELKLKNSSVNMDKVKALIDEILPHLKLLRRQSARWEKHDDLKKELKELEDQYFGFKLHELNQEFEKIKPKEAALNKKLSAVNAELKILETDLKKIELAEPKKDEKFEALIEERRKLLEKRAELHKESGRLEAKLEAAESSQKVKFASEESIRLLEESRVELEDTFLENDIKVIKKLVKALYDKISEFLESESAEPQAKSENVSEINSLKNELLEEIAKIDKKFLSIETETNKRESELQSFNRGFKKAYEAVNSKRLELERLGDERNKLTIAGERLKVHAEELSHRIKESGRAIGEFESVKVSGPAPETEALERRILRLRGELSSIGEIDESLIKETRETETRYQFLSGQLKDLEKAVADLTGLIKELAAKIQTDFEKFIREINNQFHKYFKMMFAGGNAKLKIHRPAVRLKETEEIAEEDAKDQTWAKPAETEEKNEEAGGIEIEVNIPRKKIHSLEMLSGGEKSLVSLAVLFALISVSPPPFLVLDEVDAALDEINSRRFGELVREFSKKTQFLIVTHNRATMEAADILYGVTMGEDGVSKVLSLKLE